MSLTKVTKKMGEKKAKTKQELIRVTTTVSSNQP